MSRLTCIDLFAGAGGMTEGFAQAGYSCLLANDFDEQAGETFAFNHPDVPTLIGDIRGFPGQEFGLRAGITPGELDVLAGGPPCQGFSLAGQRLASDLRNQLFLEFVRVAEYLQPRVILLENVPGITTMQGGAVVRALEAEFQAIGYYGCSMILNAADYGVPQTRKRFVLIATRDQSFGDITFPQPEYSPGGDRSLSLFGGDVALKPYRTAWEALSDLPVIDQGGGSEEMEHGGFYHNDFQRSLQGRRRPGVVFNHRATAHSSRIQERYAAIPEGRNNDALPPEIRTLKRNAWKIHREMPARTVTCNHRTDLLHPTMARGSTVREAARLQTFDDDYRFFGNLTRKAKWVTQDDQVGNAVPPLLARRIAEHLASTLLAERRDKVSLTGRGKVNVAGG